MRFGLRRRLMRAVAAGSALTIAAVPVPPAQADDSFSLTGRVSFEGAAPSVHHVSVLVYGAGSPELLAWTTVRTDEPYTVEDLPAGDYEVRFVQIRDPNDPTLGFAHQWYGGTGFRAEAETVQVTGDTSLTHVTLQEAGGITGRVSAPWTPASKDIVVWAYLVEPDGSLTLVDGDFAEPGDDYLLRGLATGTYVVKFANGNSGTPGAAYSPEFWHDAPDAASAGEVRVVQGSTTQGVDASLEEWRPRFLDRLYGADRFEAAAAMSESTFDPAASVVLIANGLNFPDALSAGPAAARLGGPVLLVTPSSIPSATRRELERLRPDRIVIVGGPASISDGVAEGLRHFSNSVVRIDGRDRFEVSLNVARYAFRGSQSSPLYVLLADGRGFADALSASATGANAGYPVVLVDGAKPRLDDATLDAFEELNTEHVFIVGGPNSLNASLDESIRSSGYSAQRMGGADRFAVSAELSRYFTADNETDLVFFATGFNFPDALSGAPIAAFNNAALLLVPSSCVPSSTLEAMRHQSYTNVSLLGGPASLGTGVERMNRC